MATAARIGWQVVNATKVITDMGHMLDIRLDPPNVVAEQVFRAVERWRWKRIERKHSRLAVNVSGREAVIAPMWKLLRSKRQDETWHADQMLCIKIRQTQSLPAVPRRRPEGKAASTYGGRACESGTDGKRPGEDSHR